MNINSKIYKKKIIFFSENLGNKGGGAEKVFCYFANYLNSKKVDVKFYISKPFFSYKKILNSSILLRCYNNFHYSLAFFSLFNTIKKEKPNLVISTDFNCNIILILISSLIGTKICIRETITRLETYKYESTLSNKIRNILIRLLYHKANLIICPSEAVSKDLLKINSKIKKKIRVIYNPIDLKKIYFLAKKKTNLKNNFFLYLGRLTKLKNVETLISVFQKIYKINKKYNLLIVGSGNLKNKISKNIKKNNMKNNIIIKDFVNNPYPLIKKANCLILPSYVEGCPNVVLEALAFNTKIICSNYAGYDEILSKKYSLIFNKDNPNDLYSKMIKFQQGKNLKNITKTYIYKNHSFKKIMKKFENNVKEII